MLATVLVTAIGLAQTSHKGPAPTLGDVALAAGDFNGAAAAYSAALASRPADPAAELGLGTIEMYRNHLDAARTHLRLALALAPNLQRARALLGAIGRRTGSPGDYRIAFTKALARVPLVAMDPLPTLRAKINGRPVTLWIDTGADGIDLGEAAVTRLHLATKIAGEGVFAGGQKAQIRTARVERIDLPGVTVRGITANTVPAGALPQGVDGLIGTAFFYHFLATIDYPHHALILRPTASSAAFLESARRSDATTTPMWLVGDHFIFTRARVNTAPEALFNVDTGGVGVGVQLTKAALDAARITPDAAHAQQGQGAAGTVRLLPFNAASVTLGGFTLHDVPGVYSPDGDPYGIFPFVVGGSLSQEFFRHTAVTFDFTSMTMLVSSP